jgi:excinuclease UvrABC ATPase subunit
MKKASFILLAIITTIFVSTLFSQEFTYVGAGKCKMCHKSEKQGQQFPLWEAMKHSKSFATLASDKAKEVAQEAGVDNPTESPNCLKCHAPLSEKAPELKEEGVGCETCHGSGSAYKKMSVMKDHAESVKNGMTEYGSPEAIKKHCLTCHENAHETTFDFDAAWEKIKHPRPKE